MVELTSLCLFFRCSRLSHNKYNDPLERYIVVGAGPLLSHLSRDRQFIEVRLWLIGSDLCTISVFS